MLQRRFTDADFMEWEVYASSGEYGTVRAPKIVFHCLSDRDRRALIVTHDGNRSEAEAFLEHAGEDELRKLLESATELN